MAFFPRIQSPCPYKSQLSAVMDGDFCRMCRRQVVDLNAMTDTERFAFLSTCDAEICVSYTLRPAIAAAALAAAAVALPTAAAAQDEPPQVAELSAEEWSLEEQTIIVGGIKDPANAEFIDDSADSEIPELPVIFEDNPTTPAPELKEGGQEASPPAVTRPAGS